MLFAAKMWTETSSRRAIQSLQNKLVSFLKISQHGLAIVIKFCFNTPTLAPSKSSIMSATYPLLCNHLSLPMATAERSKVSQIFSSAVAVCRKGNFYCLSCITKEQMNGKDRELSQTEVDVW